MQKSRTYLSSPESSQTLTASNLMASNPLSTLKTASNLLTFTERLSSPDDFTPVLQKLGSKPSVFVFCGIKNFNDILQRYVSSIGNCCFRCSIFYSFGGYELSRAEAHCLRDEYEYLREASSLLNQISELRTEFLERLGQKEQKNSQLEAYYLTVVDVIELSATTCRETILVNAESDEDVLCIIQFLQKYYCFGDLEMEKYSAFIEERKVKFEDMQVYNQLSGIENAKDYFSELVLTRVFHIFTEILENEELLTKISTLRDCACVQRKPVLNRFDQVGIKELEKAIRGDYTLKYIQCKNGVLRFSADIPDDYKRENSIALCDDVAEYIRTINDFDDLEAVELDTQEKYIINLRDRTDQLILKLRGRLEHSQAEMNQVKEQYEENTQQSAAKLSKLLGKSERVEAEIYESLMKSQLCVTQQLEKQLAQQEFVQLEMDRPDLLFTTPDCEIRDFTTLCERVEIELPQKAKAQSHVEANQEADRLDLVKRGQCNARREISQASAQILTEETQILGLKGRMRAMMAGNELKHEELAQLQEQQRNRSEVLRMKQLFSSYSKFIIMYEFRDKMSAEDQQQYARHEEFIEELRKLTQSCHSDSEEVRTAGARLKESITRFLQSKASLSYYGRLCQVCQKIETLVGQL